MAASLPILTFHSLDDRPSVISFPPRLFERGMAGLHERRYRSLTLLEVVEHLQQGLLFPERCFALTFDDGYQSAYEQAFPILQRYGFSATVFLAVGKKRSGIGSDRLPSMCDRSMLSWGEIREMQRCGIEFGAHTLTHPDLTRLSLELAESEICDSKVVIEDALSAPAASFAYPYGRYDSRYREIVSRHFVCACSDKLGLVRPNSDPYAVERVDTYYLQHEKLFTSLLADWFPWYVWARAVPRHLRRAVELKIANRFQR
jgi:peptidoglycan/xylan/chitin deacetylase (PgdA/CDA1 family)